MSLSFFVWWNGLDALGRVVSSSAEWRCGGGELVVASSVLCRAW